MTWPMSHNRQNRMESHISVFTEYLLQFGALLDPSFTAMSKIVGPAIRAFMGGTGW
jgi:hypothetical protein